MLKYLNCRAGINPSLRARVTSEHPRYSSCGQLNHEGGVRTNYGILHGRGAGYAPSYPSGFDLIPRILLRHRISACIEDLPPNWITPIGDLGAFTSDTDKIELPLT